MQKRARNGQTTAHAFRKLRDQLLAVLFQPDTLEENVRIL